MNSRAQRHPVTLFIGNAEDSIPFGRSRNVSTSGVFVETLSRPDVDSEREIWFVWGEEIHATVARVVRHSPEGVGLTFIDPSPTFLHAIKEMTGEEADPELPPALPPALE